MRINNIGNSNFVGSVGSPISKSDSKAPSESLASDHGDGIQLSKLGSVLSGLQTGSSSDEQKVERLSELVRSGAYSVDAMAVSRGIVSNSLGFA